MITPHDAAITAAFFMDGVHESWNNAPEGVEPLEVWAHGFYEFVQELTQYAEYCFKLGAAGGAVLDFPGVYDYEVSIEFGKWFAQYILDNNGASPTDDQCKGWLLIESESFFLDGEEPSDLLSKALEEVEFP